MGAEWSHPASVAQAAFYTLGAFGDVRDTVIATMDTGSRTWDYEVIPADRVERASARTRASGWVSSALTTPSTDRTRMRCLSEIFRPVAGSARVVRSSTSACREAEEAGRADETAETQEVNAEDARDAVDCLRRCQGSPQGA